VTTNLAHTETQHCTGQCKKNQATGYSTVSQNNDKCFTS